MAALAALTLLVGCGGGDSNPDPAGTELDIVVWPEGRSGDQDEASLRCSPAGGSLADAEAACLRLERMERPFVRPGGQVACTEIYGGPAVAEIRGTFDGAQVDATFARTDGCEIAFWDRHQFLFPVEPASP
ncbi:MAG TPA: SSI family serine proteinase inhibitor [Gaiellaceae bacterium]|nr:SSI family serine proteinase inhibitor [Gaiellaceae bacterium]